MRFDGRDGFRVTIQRGANIDETRRVDEDTVEIACDDTPIPFYLIREAVQKADKILKE